MNISDFGKMIQMLQMGPQPVGDVVKGPPNWFNQGLPVKGIDPLSEAMGRQGMAPAGGPNWWMGMKPNMKPSAKDSAQTSFGGAPMTPKPTPKYDAMIGKLQHAGATMKQLDQGARNQYAAWAHGAGFDVSKLPSIIGASAKQGLSRDQFLFMLAKLKQEGEL